MSFLERMGLNRSQSADNAKERLKLVLIHDRAGLSPGKLEALKDDLIRVIEKHISIDTREVQITLTRDRDQQRLVADIPILPIKERR